MVAATQDSPPKRDQANNTPRFPSRSKNKTTGQAPLSATKPWISPTSTTVNLAEKKSVISRQFEDEIALDKYTKENTPPKKKTNYNLVIGVSIVVILVFIFTLGGNLVDLATGGDGSHSWYGKNGVYNRFMSGDENINRIDSENDKNLADSLQKNKQVTSNSTSDTIKTHTEVRLLNPPKNEVAAKPLPAQSYRADDFISRDLKVHCHISQVVECTIIDFAGKLGQKPGHSVALTLGPEGVQTPKDLGFKSALSSRYSLAAGATATTGDYACTATGEGSFDCWNLKTGKGMLVSHTSAEGYNTKYTN